MSHLGNDPVLCKKTARSLAATWTKDRQEIWRSTSQPPRKGAWCSWHPRTKDLGGASLLQWRTLSLDHLTSSMVCISAYFLSGWPSFLGKRVLEVHCASSTVPRRDERKGLEGNEKSPECMTLGLAHLFSGTCSREAGRLWNLKLTGGKFRINKRKSSFTQQGTNLYPNKRCSRK
jgi:hypothetical protein